MQNLWKDSDAKAAIASHAAKGVGEDLALRVYTTRPFLDGEGKILNPIGSLVEHGLYYPAVDLHHALAAVFRKFESRDDFSRLRDVAQLGGCGFGAPAVELAFFRKDARQTLSDPVAVALENDETKEPAAHK